MYTHFTNAEINQGWPSFKGQVSTEPSAATGGNYSAAQQLLQTRTLAQTQEH